jgi:hypothetical protein
MSLRRAARAIGLLIRRDRAIGLAEAEAGTLKGDAGMNGRQLCASAPAQSRLSGASGDGRLAPASEADVLARLPRRRPFTASDTPSQRHRYRVFQGVHWREYHTR